MEEKKNNKGLIIVVCVLSVLVLALGGFIVYDKVISKSDENPKDNNIVENNGTTETNNEVGEKVEDCSFTPIKGVTIALKNSLNNNGRISSDVYINEKLSSRVSYNENIVNGCESIDKEEIEVGSDYLLFRFEGESMYTDFYLFNKNGKFISDFSELRKKYNNIWIGKNDNGSRLDFSYFATRGMEGSIGDVFCELKVRPKATDIYSITGNLKIENDKLIEENVKKINWEEAYKCNGENADDCGNINDIVCDN